MEVTYSDNYNFKIKLGLQKQRKDKLESAIPGSAFPSIQQGRRKKAAECSNRLLASITNTKVGVFD